MSTKKTAAKSSTTKTEPAAKKATTAPAPPKKKVVKKVETETPAPAPDKELQTRLEILEQSNAELKAELQEAQAQHKTAVDKKNNLLQRSKEYIIDLEKKLELSEKAKNTAQDVSDFGEKVNKQGQRKWVGVVLAVLLIVSIVWIVFLTHHNYQLQKTVQDKNTVIEDLRNQLQNLKDEVDYDTTHAANNAIQAPDAEGSKKKIRSGNKP